MLICSWHNASKMAKATFLLPFVIASDKCSARFFKICYIVVACSCYPSTLIALSFAFSSKKILALFSLLWPKSNELPSAPTQGSGCLSIRIHDVINAFSVWVPMTSFGPSLSWCILTMMLGYVVPLGGSVVSTGLSLMNPNRSMSTSTLFVLPYTLTVFTITAWLFWGRLWLSQPIAARRHICFVVAASNQCWAICWNSHQLQHISSFWICVCIFQILPDLANHKPN